ncbi:MAG: hypothetical protein ABJF50_25330 [Paracoccaceae bacterium]|uniref:hypothetical protein n=1 Tax=Yoonia sp. TaxID=2212373 RepID=UPI00328F31E6
MSEELTEAQITQLTAARENLRRAQEVWDSLADLRLQERRFWRSQSNRPANPISRTEQQISQHQDKKDQERRAHRRARLKLLWETRAARRIIRKALPSPQAVVLKYEQIPRLDLCAQIMGVTRNNAVKLMKRGGIDIHEEIALEWESGSSLRALSAKHGPCTQAISRMIKLTGRQIRPRNANPRYDAELMKKLFNNGWSTNKIAKSMGISWATVQNAKARLHQLENRAEVPS